MRPLLIALSFIASAAMACGNPAMSCDTPSSSCGTVAQSACGCGGGKVMILETITYALGELALSDNSDIRTAISLYKKEMRSLKPSIPTEAFEGGQFHPDLYAKSATPAHALQAQSDLFETIYLILNDEQKKEFPKLMGMYQHHMEYTGGKNKMCGTPAGKCGNTPKMCDTPPYQGCGGKNCKSPMKKGPIPLKR